jgi:hypothetical protein
MIDKVQYVKAKFYALSSKTFRNVLISCTGTW